MANKKENVLNKNAIFFIIYPKFAYKVLKGQYILAQYAVLGWWMEIAFESWKDGILLHPSRIWCWVVFIIHNRVALRWPCAKIFQVF